MAEKRNTIHIDEDKCTGCAECIPNCPEGALQIIDGKARLVSDLFCDGLGACIGHCPEGAIEIEEREAEPYDERRVMENIVPQGPNTIRAHLDHLKDHGADEYHKQAVEYLEEKGIRLPERDPHAGGSPHHPGGSCPGARVMDFGAGAAAGAKSGGAVSEEGSRPSELRQWPVQLMLVPPQAPYLRGAELLIAADCVPFAYADFHKDFLKDKVLLVGCPKLDDAELYTQKLTAVFREAGVKSVTCIHMEVPCCFGLERIVKSAIAESGKTVPYAEVTIGIKGGVVPQG
jgi:ferredoxin